MHFLINNPSCSQNVMEKTLIFSMKVISGMLSFFKRLKICLKLKKNKQTTLMFETFLRRRANSQSGRRSHFWMLLYIILIYLSPIVTFFTNNHLIPIFHISYAYNTCL